MVRTKTIKTMDEREIRKQLETIWKKYATGNQNMIAVYMPQAHQKAFINEILAMINGLVEGEVGKDEEQ
ncbi:MAG: hypothetical protein HC875_38280 [Anaerolineales bacterium]|nr:hypothetical protein [Anaerolineales bacterium]